MPLLKKVVEIHSLWDNFLGRYVEWRWIWQLFLTQIWTNFLKNINKAFISFYICFIIHVYTMKYYCNLFQNQIISHPRWKFIDKIWVVIQKKFRLKWKRYFVEKTDSRHVMALAATELYHCRKQLQNHFQNFKILAVFRTFCLDLRIHFLFT